MDATWTDEIRKNCWEYCACYGELPCWYFGEDKPPCKDCVAGRENPDWEHTSKPPINWPFICAWGLMALFCISFWAGVAFWIWRAV